MTSAMPSSVEYAAAPLIAMVVTLAAMHPATAGIDSAIDGLASELPPSPAMETLDQIPDAGRKLLALRSYLRARDPLAGRWSWTDAEIADFEDSAERKALLEEIGDIAAHFAAANPGYELYINTRVRSLDAQIDRWNQNRSVGEAAKCLLARWREKFGKVEETPDEDQLREMAEWLKRSQTPRRARLAAPGLSRHGQGRAIDFQIMKDGVIVAETGDIEHAWRSAGWDEKLRRSVEAVGPSFVGPLQLPHEPWHYDYDPETDEQDVTGNAD